MAKKVVTLDGHVFQTLNEAKAHYKAVREAAEIGASLPEPEKSNVIDIYQRYCEVTNWPPVSAIDVIVNWDNRLRPSGGYAQTKSLFIVDDTGESHVFSIDKALTAIATK